MGGLNKSLARSAAYTMAGKRKENIPNTSAPPPEDSDAMKGTIAEGGTPKRGTRPIWNWDWHNPPPKAK